MERIGFFFLLCILILGPIVPLRFKGASEEAAQSIWLGFYAVIGAALLFVLIIKLISKAYKNIKGSDRA